MEKVLLATTVLALCISCGNAQNNAGQVTGQSDTPVVSEPAAGPVTEPAAADVADTVNPVAFESSPIPDGVFEKMQGKSFKADCTVPRDSLRYLRVSHIDLEGTVHIGEMVCSASIADDLLDIFKRLYEAGYPIERMVLIDEYNAEDEASMRANNSSCFNFRLMTGGKRVSRHGLGIAVDINPLYNPYVKVRDDGTKHVEPATAGAYTDRDADFPYKIKSGDLCVRLFKEHGFKWGGDWKSLKDYQHFEK